MNSLSDVLQGCRDLHFQGAGGLQLAQGVIEPHKGMKQRLLLVEEAIRASPVIVVLNEVSQERYEETQNSDQKEKDLGIHRDFHVCLREKVQRFLPMDDSPS